MIKIVSVTIEPVAEVDAARPLSIATVFGVTSPGAVEVELLVRTWRLGQVTSAAPVKVVAGPPERLLLATVVPQGVLTTGKHALDVRAVLTVENGCHLCYAPNVARFVAKSGGPRRDAVLDVPSTWQSITAGL